MVLECQCFVALPNAAGDRFKTSCARVIGMKGKMRFRTALLLVFVRSAERDSARIAFKFACADQTAHTVSAVQRPQHLEHWRKRSCRRSPCKSERYYSFPGRRSN